MRTVLLLLLLTLACAPARPVFARPAAQAACPADNSIIRNLIKARLSDVEERTAMGVMYVSPDRLRLLADPSDATSCRAIMEKVGGRPINPDHVLRYGLYESDGYFFVLTVQIACPADDPYIRNGIKSVLANDRVRISMGLTHVRSEAVRVLAAPADSAMCQTLLEKTRAKPVDPNHVLRYGLYEADGYYFVGIMIYTTADQFAYVPGSLYVFDSALNVMDAMMF